MLFGGIEVFAAICGPDGVDCNGCICKMTIGWRKDEVEVSSPKQTEKAGGQSEQALIV